MGLSLFPGRPSTGSEPVLEEGSSAEALESDSGPLDSTVDSLFPTRPLTAREMLAHLQLRARLQPPLTWVFAGDSLSRPGKVPARGCSQGSFLAEFLRDSRRRVADTFVFAETPGLQLSAIGLNEVTRIERFHPDVLLLTCGVAELEQAKGNSLEFEKMFIQLVEALRKPGRVLAVNLPPCFPYLVESEEITTDALVRLEALRACSLEADLPLIDHWSHWEEHADASWFGPDGRSPSARGAREMARLMVRELGLDKAASVSQAPLQHH